LANNEHYAIPDIKFKVCWSRYQSARYRWQYRKQSRFQHKGAT